MSIVEIHFDTIDTIDYGKSELIVNLCLDTFIGNLISIG